LERVTGMKRSGSWLMREHRNQKGNEKGSTENSKE
jgi:hypothetical protein